MERNTLAAELLNSVNSVNSVYSVVKKERTSYEH